MNQRLREMIGRSIDARQAAEWQDAVVSAKSVQRERALQAIRDSIAARRSAEIRTLQLEQPADITHLNGKLLDPVLSVDDAWELAVRYDTYEAAARTIERKYHYALLAERDALVDDVTPEENKLETLRSAASDAFEAAYFCVYEEVCRHCLSLEEAHVSGQCLFSPTRFTRNGEESDLEDPENILDALNFSLHAELYRERYPDVTAERLEQLF